MSAFSCNGRAPEHWTEDRIAQNLRKGLTVARKSPEALRKAAGEIMNQTPQENEDKPAMWREGEPMPDWASQALAKSIG